ncbi:MAG: nucleoside hydrolase [Clostridia bacterium]|nr:nucleoside hydrolase [Clostridia bacterium]
MEKLDFILDTDAGADCDDMLAMSYLIYAKRFLKVNIKAVTHALSTGDGVVAIRSFFRCFGEKAPETGHMIKGANLNDNYCKYIVKEFATKKDHKGTECAARVLRKALASSKNKCVICAIGQLTNISALIRSEPDDISPLDGVSLIKEKCAKIVLMAGLFLDNENGEREPEWNVRWDVAAARDVFDFKGVPIATIPWETGVKIYTGKDLESRVKERNPLLVAFERFLNESIKGGRDSWDPVTALYAVEGTKDFLKESAKGHVCVKDNGATYFEEAADGNTVIVTVNSTSENDQAVRDTIAKYIEDCVDKILK